MLMASNQSSTLQQNNANPTCWSPVECPSRSSRLNSSRSSYDDCHDLCGALQFDSFESHRDSNGPEIDFFQSLIDSEANEEYFSSGENYFECYPPQSADVNSGAVVSSGPVQQSQWTPGPLYRESMVNDYQYQPNDWMSQNGRPQQDEWCEPEVPAPSRKRQRSGDSSRTSNGYTDGSRRPSKSSSSSSSSRSYLAIAPRNKSPTLPPLVESCSSWQGIISTAFNQKSLAVGTALGEKMISTNSPPPTSTSPPTSVPSPSSRPKQPESHYRQCPPPCTSNESSSPWGFLLDAMKSASGRSIPNANSMLPMALAAFSPGLVYGPYEQLMDSLLTQLNTVAVSAASNWETSNAQRTTMAALAARFAMAQYAAKQRKSKVKVPDASGMRTERQQTRVHLS